MRKTQKFAIVGGTVGILMAGGIAYAAWTSEGTGHGTVAAGSATVLTVSGNDATDLYPTGTIDGTVTVTNPVGGKYDIKLSKIAFVDASTTTTDCDASTVTVEDVTGLTDVLAPGDSVTKTVHISMSNLATDECQGAVFQLNYKATGASN